VSIEFVGIISVVLINTMGWVYTYGKFSQKVDNLSDIVSNGLCAKVDGISRHLAKLEGIIDILRNQR